MERSAPLSNGIVLDVKTFIDEHPMVAAQWMILLLCFFVLVADGFDTAAMAFVAPALTHELSISKLALGPVLSAALIGLAAGALIAGPIADKIGRKRVLIASVLLFSIASLASAYATTAMMLAILRLLTGLGIGAAMPNCTTLVSEFVPSGRRSFLVNLMFCGFPLGASAGGFMAAWLIPHFGWRSVFLVGGSAPILLAFLLMLLPESIGFMVVQHWPIAKIKSALLRISGDDSVARSRIEAADSFKIHELAARSSGSPVGILLSPEFRLSTIMLWIAYFMGLVLYYLLISWMPTLMRDSGASISDAARITALFPLGGGIGAIICGWLMDRVNATQVVGIAYFVTALLLVALSRSTATVGLLMIVTFLAGTAMNGAQTSMPGLAAATYPTKSRASGVSWMLGIGRLGGVTGALGGGVLLQAGYKMAAIVLGLSVAALIAALALLVKAYASPQVAIEEVSAAPAIH
jgi:AAHS family 4-hydroxybenzoate transporter-like MFS transporter